MLESNSFGSSVELHQLQNQPKELIYLNASQNDKTNCRVFDVMKRGEMIFFIYNILARNRLNLDFNIIFLPSGVKVFTRYLLHM